MAGLSVAAKLQPQHKPKVRLMSVLHKPQHTGLARTPNGLVVEHGGYDAVNSAKPIDRGTVRGTSLHEVLIAPEHTDCRQPTPHPRCVQIARCSTFEAMTFETSELHHSSRLHLRRLV